MELFDTHAHYNDERFSEDRQQVIDSIYREGVTKLVNAGYNVESSEKAIAIAEKYPWMYVTCGISPNDIPGREEEIDRQIEEIRSLSLCKKVVAIGEIGLDYYWNKENKLLQQYAFIQQIELANELKLPIVIHTREAVDDTIDILKNKISVIEKGIFHCCPLNRHLVKQALELGFYISFAGPVTFKNAKNADEIIDMVSLENMVIETDSPYLTPEPNRGKRNDSRNLHFIAEKIAKVKGISVEEVANYTYTNAKKIFKID